MLTYQDIAKAILSKKTQSLYILWGEEPYFIDKLSSLFASRLIPEEEKDFAETILYGNDISSIMDVVSMAMGYSMMGTNQLILIREAQQVRDIESIAPYMERLPETTCLVLCYKKKLDKRKALYKMGEQLNALFESAPIKDYKLPDFIISTFKEYGMMIDQATANLMAEHTGNSLEKIVSEIEKLKIALKGERMITPTLIEEHIGISKEYNNFELLRAIIERDTAKAYKIATHFATNERNYPIQMILPTLFNYFAQLMAVYYIPEANERSIMETLKIAPYMTKDYIVGARNYSSLKVFNIIRQIRLADAASKGVESSASGGEILLELLSFIFA